MNTKKKIIISAGGTGGHIYPAIAVAQALQKRLNNEVEFLFVGASDRMEMEKVPKAGFKIVGLWISGLQRRITYKNILFPFKVISSIVKSFGIINNFKPDAVIGFGGYASSAVLYAASLKKLPTLIHEQNSYAGITNKILKDKVNKICVAYNDMEKFFPENKLVKTGNPIRQDLMDVTSKRNEAIDFFKLDSNKKTVLVIGGSLGARTINESIFEGLEKLKSANINLIWQTGKNFKQLNSNNDPDNSGRNSKNVSTNYSDLEFDFSNFKISDFIYEMDLAYAAADVVISRAGALSIAELAQVAKPVILVPSPNVAEDHQTKNAMALVNKNAAILVKDIYARNNLITETLNLVNDSNKQEELVKNIRTFAMPNAAELIVDEVIKLMK
jgi:UDP-N-acetylglucosamine--N-acetylmuramyl-(pentapeptide) pyrophosphoryl-undecaprenol N-acetylglucosamine transferase